MIKVTFGFLFSGSIKRECWEETGQAELISAQYCSFTPTLMSENLRSSTVSRGHILRPEHWEEMCKNISYLC